MEDLIKEVEKKYLRERPEFRPGDKVTLHIQIIEGEKERTQHFSGIVIKDRGKGLGRTFTVRRVSYGEGVEMTFPLYSPVLKKIIISEKGKVRRAKLYYLRKKR